MIATSHVIIGGAVGVAVGAVTKNPAAALAAGIVSHLVCDAFPHLDSPPKMRYDQFGEAVWDKSLYSFAITDSLIALILVLTIWYFKDHLALLSPFAWGAFGGYLPDLVDNFPLWRDSVHKIWGFRQFHSFHRWIHDTWRNNYPMPAYWKLGVATQLVTVLPCLYYLIR